MSLYSPEEKIKWFAVTSRILLFIVQCSANCIIKDHEPKVFRKPQSPYQHAYFFDQPLLDVATRGLTHWDAEYFLHIADFGYTYENTLAFFPLYPLTVRFLGSIFQLFTNNIFHFIALPFFLTKHDSLVLMALLLNYVLFIHTASALHKLTLKVTNNERIAYLSALLFCINPASIFFSAAYSEAMFCFLSVNAMLNIESGHLVTGSLLCGLSGITRSNGLLNIGYIVYRILKTGRNNLSFVLSSIVFVSCLSISLFPFLSYQLYCFSKFCFPNDNNLPDFILKHANENNYVLAGNRSSWCDDKIPFAYGFVQKHYWDVGFLQYFEVKQAPNFLLAAPVLLIVFFGTYKFVRTHKWTVLYLGFVPGQSSSLHVECFPYFAHALFLALFGLFCMHVQVSTRLICSSCPAFYWISADILLQYMSESKEEKLAKALAKKSNMFYEPQSNVKKPPEAPYGSLPEGAKGKRTKKKSFDCALWPKTLNKNINIGEKLYFAHLHVKHCAILCRSKKWKKAKYHIHKLL